MCRAPGIPQFVLGTYNSNAIAQSACDAANLVIKKKSATEIKADAKSMIEVCRFAASKATGFPSAISRK